MFTPTLGRWAQIDPIGFDAGDESLYRFVENNPVDLTDPFGLKKYESKDGPFGKMSVEIEELDNPVSEAHMPNDGYPGLNRNVIRYGFWVKTGYKPNDKCPCVGGVRFIQIIRRFKNGKVQVDWHVDSLPGGPPFYGFDKDGKMESKHGNGGVSDGDGWTYVMDRPHVAFDGLKRTPAGDIPMLPDNYHWEVVIAAVCPKTKQIMTAAHFFLPVSKGKGVTFHGKESDDWWTKWNELTGNEYKQQ